MARTSAARPPTPVTFRLLAASALLVVLLAGLWLTAGVLAKTYNSSIVVAIAWFVVVAIAVRFVVRARPELKLPLRVTFVLTALAVGGYTAWTTLRDDVVDEDVVTAPAAPAAPASHERPQEREKPAAPQNVLVASGSFEGIEKDTSGSAKVIQLAGSRRRKLTLTDFDTAPGPDYRVYLAKGRATLDSVPDYEDLGGLKGNKGDQQYEVPEGLDVKRYDTVVIWCRAFSVGIGQARLTAR